MRKPDKLRSFGGKFPDEETIRKTYKLEPRKSPEEEREAAEKKRLYNLNVAMSQVPLETWDAWISHLTEYDFWPTVLKSNGTHFCLFCQVTDLNCLLCSGKGPIACARHETEGEIWEAPGKTFYSRMVEVGIEKIQAHADWLNLGRTVNENT